MSPRHANHFKAYCNKTTLEVAKAKHRSEFGKGSKERGGKLITPNYMKHAMTADAAAKTGGHRRSKLKKPSQNRILDKYLFIDPQISIGLQRHKDRKLHKFFMELEGGNHLLRQEDIRTRSHLRPRPSIGKTLNLDKRQQTGGDVWKKADQTDQQR